MFVLSTVDMHTYTYTSQLLFLYQKLNHCFYDHCHCFQYDYTVYCEHVLYIQRHYIHKILQLLFFDAVVLVFILRMLTCAHQLVKVVSFTCAHGCICALPHNCTKVIIAIGDATRTQKQNTATDLHSLNGVECCALTLLVLVSKTGHYRQPLGHSCYSQSHRLQTSSGYHHYLWSLSVSMHSSQHSPAHPSGS